MGSNIKQHNKKKVRIILSHPTLGDVNALNYELVCEYTETGHRSGMVWVSKSNPNDRFRKIRNDCREIFE